MAEPKLTKKQNANQKTLSQQALGKAYDFGAGLANFGLGGLHTYASLASVPSRVGWGTINTLTGGERGMGNLNPIDSTGGVEAGHVLGVRTGLLPPNDPKRWELRDVSEGIVDIAGDPTTYAAGVGAIRKGVKTLGDIVRAPKIINAASNAVSKSQVGNQLRSIRSKFDYRVDGTTHPVIQPEMVARTRKLEELNRADDLMLTQMARQQMDEQKRLGLTDMEFNDRVRMGFENINHPSALDPFWHGKRLQTINQELLKESIDKGTGIGVSLDDMIGFAPRRIAEGLKQQFTDHATSRGFLKGSDASDVGRIDQLKGFTQGTTGVNNLFADKMIRQIVDNPALGPSQKATAIEKHLDTYYPKLILKDIKDKKGNVVGNRYQQLADYITSHPRLVKNEGVFTNTPLADQSVYLRSMRSKNTAADVVYNVIPKTMGNMPEGKSIQAFLNEQGFDVEKGLEQIAARAGKTVDDIKAMQMPHDVANQLSKYTPNYRGPALPDANGMLLRNIARIRKATMLMFPKSRFRDATSGVVQNILTDKGSPLPLIRGYGDANRILSGKLVKHDYSHHPDIQKWFADQGLDIRNPTHNTRENQTEALRQLASVDLPQEHYGLLEEFDTTKPAYTLSDLVRKVPGQTESTLRQRLVKDPVKAWLGMSGTQWRDPRKVRGYETLNDAGKVDRLKESTFAPVKASELVSGETDAMNRMAPYLARLQRGEPAADAARAVNTAQVDYNPAKFTEQEKLLRQWMPFYSFNSRMLANTARQLSDPASRTALLVKAAHKGGGNDETLPDHVADSAQIPLGLLPDGSKRNISGFGLMHEPATTLIGNAMAGKGRDVGYQLLAQLSPEVAGGLGYVTGQDFHMRGEPLTNRDGGSGRLIRNIRQQLGVDALPEDGGPRGEYQYPGRKWVDFGISAITPLQLLMNQARTATDPRKEAYVKALNLLTGVNVVDTSPEAQQRQVSKRVDQSLYDIEGVRKFELPYMTVEQLEYLKTANPAAYQRYMQLQGMRKQIRQNMSTRPKKAESTRKTKTATIRKR